VKVGEMARLLEGIAAGLADLSKKTADGLDMFRSAVQPFSDQTVEQFAALLGQCEEYRRTGVVAGAARRTTQPKPPKEKAAPLTVSDAAGRVRQLLAEINQGAVTSARIDSLMGEINKGLKSPECDELLTVLGIAGKAKTKAKAVEKVREVLNSQLEMHVKAQAFGTNG
jgi:hypothetical protein